MPLQCGSNNKSPMFLYHPSQLFFYVVALSLKWLFKTSLWSAAEVLSLINANDPIWFTDLRSPKSLSVVPKSIPNHYFCRHLQLNIIPQNTPDANNVSRRLNYPVFVSAQVPNVDGSIEFNEVCEAGTSRQVESANENGVTSSRSYEPASNNSQVLI